MNTFPPFSWRGRAVVCAVPAGIGIVSLSLALFGRLAFLHVPPPSSLRQGGSAPKRFPLETSPDHLALGVLQPGQSAVAEIVVRNPSSGAVKVERVETTCPCVKVAPVSFEIGPAAAQRLAVRFDPSHEPEFRGELSVEVTGIDDGESLVLRARVDFEVRGQRGARAP